MAATVSTYPDRSAERQARDLLDRLAPISKQLRLGMASRQSRALASALVVADPDARLPERWDALAAELRGLASDLHAAGHRELAQGLVDMGSAEKRGLR